MKDFISNNGGVLVVIGACLAIGAAYLEWRIDSRVTDAVNTKGYVTPAQIGVFKANQEALKEDVGELKNVDEKLDGKIERIVQILLED